MILLFSLFAAISVDKIRGVSPANAGQYRRAISARKNTFTCFDKSKTISLDRLNDGYCDCPDGSDEPGTNACGTGEFYCRNTGSVPRMIPKWMVNDGVCDCCDGSDEAGNPHAHCEDVCGAIRRRSIEFRSNLTNMTIEGGKLRNKYSDRGRLELTLRRKQLQSVESQKNKVFKAASLVEQIYWEIRSNGENADMMINQLNFLVTEIKNEFHEIEKTEKNVRKGTRKIREEIPHYGRFNLKKRQELYFNVENCIVWLPDFGNVFYRLHSAYKITKAFLKAFTSGKEPEHATSQFNKLSAITSKIENSTIKVQKVMETDFGPDKEFLPLYKQWYYYEKDDWYLEFYPFENCTKKSKKDSRYVFNFGHYNRSEQLKWIFTGGQSCGYRAPDTTLEVKLHCRMKDEILGLKEWAKCQFRLDFGTPGACIEEYKQQVDSMDDVTLDEWAKDSGLYPK
ncbi:hypothetical protein TRFO_06864 [Tritrichomonas foetus]|uniref:Glucosidase 2 subunit beta n=1 Tax=Tritrichomonas foetus TaxID=1144522 RepID=A0A1J4K075_9EUKA|nr:hypothetical protein TRFO_06864 [Tritrichomonas foetus]|eukprot:OHT03180.1 hypothetical protein TRFO_06864 [Tritrichomonas foetus]